MAFKDLDSATDLKSYCNNFNEVLERFIVNLKS